MQPHPITSVMQLSVTAAAIVIAASAISFTVWTWREKRNAELVQVGISVLRVEPKKEYETSMATREWALNLIDENAGGVIFSPEARAHLLREHLEYFSNTGDGHFEDEPAPPGPSPEPPK